MEALKSRLQIGSSGRAVRLTRNPRPTRRGRLRDRAGAATGAGGAPPREGHAGRSPAPPGPVLPPAETGWGRFPAALTFAVVGPRRPSSSASTAGSGHQLSFLRARCARRLSSRSAQVDSGASAGPVAATQRSSVCCGRAMASAARSNVERRVRRLPVSMRQTVSSATCVRAASLARLRPALIRASQSVNGG